MSMIDNNIYLIRKNVNIIDLLRVQRILKCYNELNSNGDDIVDSSNNISDIVDKNSINNDDIVDSSNSISDIITKNDKNTDSIIDNNDISITAENISIKDDGDMNIDYINDDIEWLDSIIDDDTNDSNNITRTFNRLSITSNTITSNTINESKPKNINNNKVNKVNKVNTINKMKPYTTFNDNNDDENDYIDDNDVFNNDNITYNKKYSSSNACLTSSTLPIQINHKKPSSSRPCNEHVKDFLISKGNQPVLIAYSEKSCIGTFNSILDCSLFCSDTNIPISSSFRRKSNMGSILYGGVLLITSKPNVEKWADLCRMNTNTKLHVYTDSLKLRRQLGSNRLTQFDIVITTFEIARAKEIFIPLNRNIDETIEKIDEDNTDVSWLSSKDRNQSLIERSNLHVLKWHTLIIDWDDMSIMKPTSTTGKALLSLDALNTIKLFKGPSIKEPLPKNDIIAMKSITIKSNHLSTATLDAR